MSVRHRFIVRLAGPRVRIETDSLRAVDALRFLFGGHAAADDGEGVAHEVGVASAPEGGFLLGCDGRSVARVRDDDLEIALVQLVQYHLVADETATAVFHGGALVRDGLGLMLAGAAGAGKTTLTASLLAAGHGFLSDELALVDGQGRLDGFSRPLNVKAGSLALLSANTGLRAAFEDARTSAGITLVPWPRAGADVRLARVVLPEYRAGAAFSAEVLSPGRAAAALMACLLNARNLPRGGLEVAGRIASGAPVVKLGYSRVDDVYAWLDRQTPPRNPARSIEMDDIPEGRTS